VRPAELALVDRVPVLGVGEQVGGGVDVQRYEFAQDGADGRRQLDRPLRLAGLRRMLGAEMAGLGDVERPASEVEVAEPARRGFRRAYAGVEQGEDERVVPAAAAGEPAEDLVTLGSAERIRFLPDRALPLEADEGIGGEELIADRIAYPASGTRCWRCTTISVRRAGSGSTFPACRTALSSMLRT
jgi:hypothetical protein